MSNKFETISSRAEKAANKAVTMMAVGILFAAAMLIVAAIFSLGDFSGSVVRPRAQVFHSIVLASSTVSESCSNGGFSAPGYGYVTATVIGGAGNGSSGNSGGQGASITGTFPVTSGAWIGCGWWNAGGGGGASDGGNGGAGGGGSAGVGFCNTSGCGNWAWMIVAGGGGGAGGSGGGGWWNGGGGNGGSAGLPGLSTGTFNGAAGSGGGGWYQGGGGGGGSGNGQGVSGGGGGSGSTGGCGFGSEGGGGGGGGGGGWNGGGGGGGGGQGWCHTGGGGGGGGGSSYVSASVRDISSSWSSGGSSISLTFTYWAPRISGVSPSTGIYSGGTSVTISGSWLDNMSTSATFDGQSVAISCSQSSSGSSSCTVISPGGTPGTTVCIFVTTGGGQQSNCGYFTYVAGPPSITSMSPTNGWVVGGTSVVLNVSLNGATGVQSVYFDGNPVSFSPGDSSVVTFTTPSISSPSELQGSTGASVYVIVNGGAQSTNTETFYYTPEVVSGVSPNAGPLSGGGNAAVSGSGFSSSAITPTCQVKFGSIPSSSCSIPTPTTIIIGIPSAGSNENVPVTVGLSINGNWYWTPPGPTYTFIGKPIIYSMSAYSGGPGSTITVFGTNFKYGNASPSSVDLCHGPGNCMPASFSGVSLTQMSVRIPGLGPGVYAVQVTTPGGQTTSNR